MILIDVFDVLYLVTMLQVLIEAALEYLVFGEFGSAHHQIIERVLFLALCLDGVSLVLVNRLIIPFELKVSEYLEHFELEELLRIFFTVLIDTLCLLFEQVNEVLVALRSFKV